MLDNQKFTEIKRHHGSLVKVRHADHFNKNFYWSCCGRAGKTKGGCCEFLMQGSLRCKRCGQWVAPDLQHLPCVAHPGKARQERKNFAFRVLWDCCGIESVTAVGCTVYDKHDFAPEVFDM
eukprot:TRINITY_DN80590_c0_g1_i2.p4 TRINITY_DN80590_c0_g1~~TRINITY_DN80590_c0_g1_i2.p4  ORF type:complete len:121 (-),score=9.44 TRINITY_DN80590_c0_g1_i2:334-696(-)